MGLSNLPAVVLDVLVEFAGYEQGWRLEIASQSLKAASMECAAIRLGKCRWVGGDREGVAFKPSWRHVAAATRRGPYLVRCGPPRVPGSVGSQGFGGRRYMDFRGLRASRLLRREAAKFIIKPAQTFDGAGGYGHGAAGGEGTIHRSTRHEDRLGLFTSYAHGGDRTLIGVWTNHACQWLLNLESHTSHLPFRHGRGESWGRLSSFTQIALTAETAVDTSFQVDHWELVPAMLAADERFEWRVPESPTMPSERLPWDARRPPTAGELYGEPDDTDEDEH